MVTDKTYIFHIGRQKKQIEKKYLYIGYIGYDRHHLSPYAHSPTEGGKAHMKEKTIEKTLVMAVRSKGGLCPKWVSPGLPGYAASGRLGEHGCVQAQELCQRYQ